MTATPMPDYYPTRFNPEGPSLPPQKPQRIAIFQHDGMELGRRLWSDIGLRQGQKILYAGQERKVKSAELVGNIYRVELGGAK